MANRRTNYRQTEGMLALNNPAVYPPVREMNFREVTLRHDERKRQAAQPRTTKRFRIKPKHVLVTLIVFSLIFAVLYRQTMIDRQILELHNMRTLLQNEKKRAEDINLELAMRLNIDKVQSVARDEMGMNYPSADQTRIVILPPVTNQSTAMSAEGHVSQTASEDKGFMEWLEELLVQMGQQ